MVTDGNICAGWSVRIIYFPFPTTPPFNNHPRPLDRKTCHADQAPGSECIVTVVRLAYAQTFKSSYDVTWVNVPVILLSTVELGVGILCACLPTYRPLWVYLFPRSRSNKGTPGKASDEGYNSSGSGSKRFSAKRAYSGGATGLPSGNGWKGSRLGSGSTNKRDEAVVGEEEVYGDAVHLRAHVMRGPGV